MKNKHTWTFGYVEGKGIGNGWWLMISSVEELSCYHEAVDTVRAAQAFQTPFGHGNGLSEAAGFRASSLGSSWAVGLASVMSQAHNAQIRCIEEGHVPLLLNANGGFCFLTKNTTIVKTLQKESLSFDELPEDKKDEILSNKGVTGKLSKKDITFHLDEALGFVSPLGEFIHVKWGHHNDIAKEIIEKNNWQSEYTSGTYCSEEDFLTIAKKYAVINAADMRRLNVIYNNCYGLTRKQRDTLYNRVIDYDNELANNIIQGDIEKEVGVERV